MNWSIMATAVPLSSILAILFACLIAFAVIDLHADEGASPLIDQSSFVHSFDLNGDYARYLYRVKNARIWDEFVNGYDVRYWAPIKEGIWAEIVYAYHFARPIETASLRISLMNFFDKGDVNLLVDVDEQFENSAQHQSLKYDFSQLKGSRRYYLTPLVAGSHRLFVRVRMRGTQINTNIMTTQFARTTVDPKHSKPNVYHLEVTLQDF